MIFGDWTPPDRKQGPTDIEYDAFDGMHCSYLWESVGKDWRCPVCDRTKRQIMQWGKRTGSNARRYGPEGWKAGLHRHHDHGPSRRFPSTVVCGGCNYLDARLKRRCGASGVSFSFSPTEMRSVLDLAAVQAHKPIRDRMINYERAAEIYERHTSSS